MLDPIAVSNANNVSLEQQDAFTVEPSLDLYGLPTQISACTGSCRTTAEQMQPGWMKELSNERQLHLPQRV
ncbi:MAG: hypothetical protein KDA89_02595 [Planctomycetaceae bacterium]|nr:hypothetical protein [Planctomycetaceae bacterium]